MIDAFAELGEHFETSALNTHISNNSGDDNDND